MVVSLSRLSQWRIRGESRGTEKDDGANGAASRAFVTPHAAAQPALLTFSDVEILLRREAELWSTVLIT